MKAQEEKVELKRKQKIAQEMEAKKEKEQKTKFEEIDTKDKGIKAQENCNESKNDDNDGDAVTIPVAMNKIKRQLKDGGR